MTISHPRDAESATSHPDAQSWNLWEWSLPLLTAPLDVITTSQPSQTGLLKPICSIMRNEPLHPFRQQYSWRQNKRNPLTRDLASTVSPSEAPSRAQARTAWSQQASPLSHSDNSYPFSASISPAKQPESADAVLERSPTADQVDSTPQANRYRTPRRVIASSESDDSSMTMTTPRKSRPCGIYHPSPTKNIDALPRLLANPHDGLREQVMDGSTSELITAPLTLRARDVRKLTDISFQKNPTDRPGNSLAANHRRADSAGNVALSLLSRHSNSPTFHSPISSASHAHSIPRQPYLRTLIPARHSGIYAAVNEKFSSVHDHAIPL